MSYKDAYHPLVKAGLKKLDKPVVEKKATTFNCWRSALLAKNLTSSSTMTSNAAWVGSEGGVIHKMSI